MRKEFEGKERKISKEDRNKYHFQTEERNNTHWVNRRE